MGIIPIQRNTQEAREHLFETCETALNHNEILIIFPEGSRGNPEKLGTLKKGIYHLLKDKPTVPVVPIVMYGLGRALPRGEALFVPFNCDVAIGEAFYSQGYQMHYFMAKITKAFTNLLNLCATRRCE